MGRHLRKVACPLLLSGGTPVAIREATGPDTQHELAPVRRPMLRLGGMSPRDV
jgi:hypothetical protein